MASSKSKRTIPRQIFRFFSSYALAAITMALLIVVTFFGTLEQQHNGLYLSQVKWFDSFLVTDFEFAKNRHFPLLLPGGYLLMIVLSINLLCGAIINARKSWKFPGMIIAHGSILFMLLAGLVSFYGKVEGAMQLWEGETSNKFTFFHERVVSIEKYDGESFDPSKRSSWVIPMKYFSGLEVDEDDDGSQSRGREFFQNDLPFEFTLFGYHRNSFPVSASDVDKKAGRDAEGFVLRPAPLAEQDEANRNGIYMAVRPKGGGAETRHILWEGSRSTFPLTLTFGDEKFLVSLAKDHRILPFKVTLNEATREYHPGTERPKEFKSDITHIAADGTKDDHTIRMNVPLRDGGWTLFQSQFGTSEAVEGAGDENSTFQVVSNPSDQWPLYSLVAATIGLVIHFLQKLITYATRASRRRDALAP